jgi:hypothetical protein
MPGRKVLSKKANNKPISLISGIAWDRFLRPGMLSVNP